jgi:hypothetical protein
MKIIDLLNKIANDEELPKKIKFESSKTIYELNDYTQRYIGKYMNNILILEHIDIESLNKKVEIIEDTPKEDKKIAKVGRKARNLTNQYIKEKLNEIIDKINKNTD